MYEIDKAQSYFVSVEELEGLSVEDYAYHRAIYGWGRKTPLRMIQIYQAIDRCGYDVDVWFDKGWDVCVTA